MSWIKDNQFIVTLGGVTLVGAAALAVVGMQFSSGYSDALAKYQDDSTKVADAQGLALYPTPENVTGKQKALKDYRSTVTDLQNLVFKYRPQAIPNIAPQEFTNRAKAATGEIAAAFTAGKTTFPDQFFSGFENYTGTLPRETATGILDYELGAAKEMFLALAKSNPTQLVNVYRERLVEEDGAAWTAGASDVARPLPFEVTFKGSEKSLRSFLSDLAKSDKYYYVIRTMRITNEKKTAPSSGEAAAAPAPEPAAPAAAPANGGFVLPGDPAPAAGATPAAEAAPAAAPAPAPVDSSRILTQVLGSEDLTVFLKVDVFQFLPVKDLPQP